MESLYRKYRPQTFDSVVGQQHIVSTLEHAVREGRLSHAYLFCGPRGTGKTTMARILAKSLLCDNPHDHMPCGGCAECREIAAGVHPDVYELDAASRTGVDNVREEIINSVGFAPVRGGYKVYIIDEVHMLTTAAFNALLKTLEEPPEHVVFVLATTDPQKVPETILSRCQRFDFHRIGNEDIVCRLRYICSEEGFEADDAALELVAKHARGGLRDALSTLEQLSVFGAGSIRLSDAQSLLGEVASSVLGEFVRGIASRDTVGLFKLVGSQADEGNDLLELTRDLVAHVRDVYMVRMAGADAALFGGNSDNLDALAEEAALFESADRLSRMLVALDDAAVEMRTASDPRLVLEVAFTRLARPEADLTVEALAERVARLEVQLASGVCVAPAALGGAGGAAPTEAPPAPAGASAAAASVSASDKRAEMPGGRLAAGSSAAGGSAAAVGAGAADHAGASAGRAALPWEAPAQSAPSAAPAATAAAMSPVPASATAPSAADSAAPAPVPAESAPVSAAPAPAASSTAAPASAPSAQAATPVPSPAASAPTAAELGELQRKWAQAVANVVAAQPSRGALLQSSRALSDTGEILTIGFPAGSTFAIKMLGRPDSHKVIEPIVHQVFGVRTIEYVMAEASAPKPAQTTPRPAPKIEVPAAPAVASATVGDPAPSVADEPAPAAEPVPEAPSAPGSAAHVDVTTHPTAMPEPVDIDEARRQWEDEYVPYDDSMIAGFESGGASADVPDPDIVAPAASGASAGPGASAVPSAPVDQAPPAAPAPGTASPSFSPAGVTGSMDHIADEDMVAVLGNIFGDGVKLTPVEDGDLPR